MDRKTIIREIIEISKGEPTLPVVQATQLLTTALLIVDSDPVSASVLYGRAINLIRKAQSDQKRT